MALPYSATTDPLRQRCSRFGGPGQIRTGDLRLRRPSLYPTELRAQNVPKEPKRNIPQKPFQRQRLPRWICIPSGVLLSRIRMKTRVRKQSFRKALNKNLSLSLDSGRIRLCEAPCGADITLFRDSSGGETRAFVYLPILGDTVIFRSPSTRQHIASPLASR